MLLTSRTCVKFLKMENKILEKKVLLKKKKHLCLEKNKIIQERTYSF